MSCNAPAWQQGGGNSAAVAVVVATARYTVNLFFFVLVLHPEPPCVSQKWAIKEISQSRPVSGFWKKASLHMYWARIDVSAN